MESHSNAGSIHIHGACQIVSGERSVKFHVFLKALAGLQHRKTDCSSPRGGCYTWCPHEVLLVLCIARAWRSALRIVTGEPLCLP